MAGITEEGRRDRWVGLGAAVGVNALIVLLLWSAYDPKPPRGREDGERVVQVEIVRAPPVPEPEPEAPPEVAAPEPEPQPVEDAAPVAEAPEAAPPPPSLPQVALPDVERGQGVPSGVVGLDCNAVFSDPDKAAECAGREVLSGWQAEVDGLGEDWERIAERLKDVAPGAVGGMIPPERRGEFGAAISQKRAMQRRREASPIADGVGDAGAQGGTLDYLGVPSFIQSNEPVVETPRDIREDGR